MSKKPASTLAERKGCDCPTVDRRQPTSLLGRLFPALPVALALAGCGGGGGADESVLLPGSPRPPTTAASSHGRFVGAVKIGDVQYFADALVTVDRMVRLYVGAPDPDYGGAIQQARPVGSAQFIGNLEVRENTASGSGVVIGQGCADAQDLRFCGETAPGEINVVIDYGQLLGEIRVTTSEIDETWLLDLGRWPNYYNSRVSPGSEAGQYQEGLAEFALDGDTIVSIDQAGELFFQSANSGCTGTGTIAPHLDGAFYVNDVSLTIGNCSEPFTYLNGEFEGLATQTPSNYWNYDALLRIWLSKPEGSSSPAAVTMLGYPL